MKNEVWSPTNRGRVAIHGHTKTDGMKNCHVCGRPLTERLTLGLKKDQRRICFRQTCIDKVWYQGLKASRQAGWDKMVIPMGGR